jgi:hypothetical protein
LNVLQESAKGAILPMLSVKGRHSSVGKRSFGEAQPIFSAIGLRQSDLTALTVAHFLLGCAESNVAVRVFIMFRGWLLVSTPDIMLAGRMSLSRS